MIDHNVRSPVAAPALGPVRSARHRVDGDRWTVLVLGAALVTMALVAGLNFTFAVAVMPNVAGADDLTFVATMQRFNSNPAFPLTFTAAMVLTPLAAVLQRRHGRGVALRWTVAALVLYGIVLAITFGINIPLNDEIDQAGDPARIADLAHVRDQFEGPWVVTNIVRTLLSIASVAALACALFLHRRSTGDPEVGASAGGTTWAPPTTTFRAASSPSPDPAREARSVR